MTLQKRAWFGCSDVALAQHEHKFETMGVFSGHPKIKLSHGSNKQDITCQLMSSRLFAIFG